MKEEPDFRENDRPDDRSSSRHERRRKSSRSPSSRKRHSSRERRHRSRSGSPRDRESRRGGGERGDREINNAPRNKHGRVSKRRKPSIYWDVAPEGFEHMTPMQYKALTASGQLPASTFAPGTLGPSLDGGYVSMQSRRIYIGGIPFGIAGDQMVDFFNQKMHEQGLAVGPGNPVLACQINIDKNFAFLEFRTH